VSARGLARLLAAYALLVALACALVHHAVAVEDGGRARETIATVWLRGEKKARAVVATEGAADPRIQVALAVPGAVRVDETVVGEGPILTSPDIVFALSFVAGKDGVKATIGDRSAYVTPDDLLSHQAYDKGESLPGLGLAIGADVPLILALLADELHVSVPELRARATFRRIRVARKAPLTVNVHATPEALSASDAEGAAIDAARYLARGVGPDGRFRYAVDATTNRTVSGYDWPRHAGATYFVAEAAARTGDPTLRAAALRAASLLRGEALGSCADVRCVGTDRIAEIGSSSLAVIAFAEIVRTHLDDSYRDTIAQLALFLRRQQRADGEFMHEFDRETSRPIDVQLLYFSGEAALALARAHTVTGDPADLEAASRALAHLVGPAWSFFGDRYYFGEEHWTCQAMDDLWERAPDRRALDFCLRWHAYSRRMQYRTGDSPMDVDGAFGVGVVVTPRLTPVGSRSEAAAATLDAARKAGVAESELDALDAELRHALALLVRHQLRPGLTYLFADPGAVYGGMPGSPVDWQLRIDYAQHAGCALFRWADLTRSVTH
jgi:hypothetical protein